MDLEILKIASNTENYKILKEHTHNSKQKNGTNKNRPRGAEPKFRRRADDAAQFKNNATSVDGAY